ncbi:protein NRT1/ PTR FAMILY 8.3 [Selaginella moellendorffii]|nr:protein NRT1/ PTR FAMILY 8.3 [Selaginella moellendorffii]|eukprot:XP_002972320.2 protein NRT1/ PTR FAMILY 8.3 [Selaginella moellendorffii]
MAPVDSCTTPLLQDGQTTEAPLEDPKQSSSSRQNVCEDDDVDGTYYTGDGSVDSSGRRSIRAKTGGWKACPFILGNEFCERLAYYGINTNLVVYLTTVLHQGNAAAAKSVTAWSGTCYLTTFIGAFLADSYWGRYWTIGILSIFYAIGMILLTLSASLPSLKPSVCPLDNTPCESATPGQMAFFYTALYLIAFGTGGIKPCVSSFGADQFDTGDPTERAHMTSFFNWFYFSINVGALIASSVIVYIQVNVGWGIGFAIPAVTMLVAICTFFFGTPLYRNQKPGGSSLTRIAQVIVAAIAKSRVQVPADERLLYEVPDKESAIQGSRKIEHTDELTCLDKAATQTAPDLENRPSPWRLCTVTQVEEVKIFVRMLPIWASTIVFFTVYSQMSTFFVEQGQRMDPKLGPKFNIPAASLTVFDTLTIIVCVPLYDWFLVPLVRKFTGHPQGFTQIQRMGIGLVLATASMLVAAVVEVKRLQLAAEFDLLDNVTDPVPMSILWQIPQYFLIGASEIFTAIGQLEFFYDQAPDAMRSLASALALSTTALGNYLSSFLVAVISATSSSGSSGWIPNNLNRGHLDYFFLVVAALSALNGLFFWACSRGYRYKKVTV